MAANPDSNPPAKLHPFDEAVIAYLEKGLKDYMKDDARRMHEEDLLEALADEAKQQQEITESDVPF